MEECEKKKRFIINAIYYSLIVGIVLGVCKYILPVMVPFILAFLIAALIQIPVKKLTKGHPERKKMMAVFFCIFFCVIFFALAVILGAKLLRGAGEIVVSAPEIYNDRIAPVITKVTERLEEMTSSIDILLARGIEETLENFSQNVGQYVTDFSIKAVRMLSGGATKIPGFIVKLVVTVVAAFFMAVDFDRMIEFVKKRIPIGKEETFRTTLDYVKNIIFIYLKSYSFLFLLTFIELFIGFLIFRIPYAALLALAIAVFDILPVLGTGGILLPWAAILCLLGNIPLALQLLALYLIITVIRNTLEPKIVGRQIGLHPVATLIFMFIGLKVLGIVGMVVFPVGLSIFINLEKNGVVHIFSNRKKEE